MQIKRLVELETTYWNIKLKAKQISKQKNLQIKDGRGNLKKIQNGSYFH